MNNEGPLNWFAAASYHEAAILDELLVKELGCRCYSYKDIRLCFSDGAIGALSSEQEKLCRRKREKELTPEMLDMLEKARECKKEQPHLVEWGACMRKLLPE